MVGGVATATLEGRATVEEAGLRAPVILGGARTPIGSLMGTLSGLRAPVLGSAAIAEALRRSGVPGDEVDEVIMGNVLSAGLGQAPARQAALGAGLPRRTECLTINKMCGSGLKAVMLAAQAILTGDAEVVVAGGMESMSNAPYLLEKARGGYRLGHGQLVDSMIRDGLWDVYNDLHMGGCAELCARRYAFSREEQDAYALESYRRAQQAQRTGRFAEEIVAVEVPGSRGGSLRVETDEEPGRLDLEKFRRLRPAFEKEGTVTAGNASTINDGAAAVVVTSLGRARERGWKPVARILSQAAFALEPEWFTVAPIGAIRKALDRAKLTVPDIDLWEINEAFSVVPMAAMRELGIPHDRLNVRGGAVALGHPIGASGARVLVTLLYAMEERQARLGVASLCIGGGEAVAVVVERLAA